MSTAANGGVAPKDQGGGGAYTTRNVTYLK